MTPIWTLIMILHWTTQVLATANDFKITAINESSGILFQDLGQVKLSNEVYTLLTFINLTHINEKITMLNNYYSISKDICNLARSSHISNDCYNQLKYIRTKLNSIQSLFNIVAHKIDTYTTRHKRGLINGISYATKWLFGIPNSDDADFYSDSINQLINNQKQTDVLMQQQVSIISGTITNFNNSLQRMNENVITLNKNLKNFNKFQNDVSQVINEVDTEIQISNHLILLIEMSDELSSLLNQYVNDIS
ncbi:hypothetical protein HHI36_023705 [Cryptolaemus montrouzieri]|uniref:Uncharacterized protein n=1 Tax=Cryptolaemus montrouzieri TaxID=559131 RepID=A0ABD2PHL4_9CUCU